MKLVSDIGKLVKNRDRKTLYVAAAIAVVVVAIVFLFRPGKERVEALKVPVEVEAVTRGPITETMELAGWIKAKEVVDVRSKVSGRIESLELEWGGKKAAVEEGTAVTKGDQIAVIDRQVYAAEVAVAQAEAKAAEVELADAQREKERITTLFKGGSATEQSKDKAVTAAELAIARAGQAKARLELAEISLRESSIISPIDGVVTAKHIDRGNLINVGDKIVTIEDINTVKVIAAFAERFLPKVKAGAAVKVRVDAFADREFDAAVYSVHPALDEQTRTVQVEIRIDNSEYLLKPGMFARVTIVTDSREDAVVVSRDVVLGGRIEEPYVYVVNDGIAHKREVRVGIISGQRCEIAEGLAAGEILAVKGMTSLTDGAAVEVVRTEDIIR